ncbi:MAG: hypothetical protein KAR83_09445 [Thermodesulfovibrionales bacterium]|nr:hypothetical protein [Thermodesulfovibrionales bacterium]
MVVAPGPPAFDVTVESLKKKRAFEGVPALRGEVRVRIKRDGRKVGGFKGALAYRPPDTMRLRMLTPFGTTAADLVRVVGRTEVFVPGKERLYVGWTPPLKEPVGAEYSAYIDNGWPVLDVTSKGELASRYRFDPATGKNISIEAFSGGEGQRALEVRFSVYDGNVPGIIVFDFGGLEIEIEMEFPEVVEGLEDRLFHPFEKEDREILPLEALFSGK